MLTGASQHAVFTHLLATKASDRYTERLQRATSARCARRQGNDASNAGACIPAQTIAHPNISLEHGARPELNPNCTGLLGPAPRARSKQTGLGIRQIGPHVPLEGKRPGPGPDASTCGRESHVDRSIAADSTAEGCRTASHTTMRCSQPRSEISPADLSSRARKAAPHLHAFDLDT